ncbi:homeotic protein female sterile [Trichonephila clavipes]|nr:homeotic protein female sterile [Trichonephila clavipes]
MSNHQRLDDGMSWRIDTGSIERKLGQGRPKATTAREDHHLWIIVRRNRGATVSQLSLYWHAATVTWVSRDRKAREENLRIEEQKEKLRIEEREEKLRFEQLRLVTDGEVSHIIAREPDDKANSYEHVKDLLLKRFKLTPEKFRQLFVTHQKASERTWIDFYHELNTYFNGWIDGLKIDTFNKLSDLIITDQLKRKTPFEFKEYYLDEWANMNSPVQLAEN